MGTYGAVLAGGMGLVGMTGRTFGQALGYDDLPKEMLPIGYGDYERPIAFYSIRNQLEAGVEQVFCIVSPSKLEGMRNQLGRYFGQRRIEYVVQEKAGGTAHAVECLGEKVGKVFPLLVTFGDEFIWTPDALSPLLKDDGSCIRIGTHKVPMNEAHLYGIVDSSDGNVTRILEKSNDVTGDPHALHAYFFGSDEIYRAARDVEHGIEDNGRDEKQLSQAVDLILRGDGYNSDVFEVLLDGDRRGIEVLAIKSPEQYRTLAERVNVISANEQWRKGWFPKKG